MKRRKSLSRFLLWILIVLEGLSLAVVIGFLYAMLDGVITREYQYQTERQTAEIQSLILQRRDFVQARIEEISINNGISVSLLLGMSDKAEELMGQLYPPTDGASFYLRHSQGQTVPAPTVDLTVLDRPDFDAGESSSTGWVPINSSVMVFAKPVRRGEKNLGHVIGLYDIVDDPEVKAWGNEHPNIRLFARIDDRYVELSSLQAFRNREGPGEISRGKPFTGAALVDRKAYIPLKDFDNLFALVSDAPLVKKRWNLITFLVLICLPLFGLTIFVSFFILKRVTSSINALAQNAKAIADSASPQDLDEQRVQHEEFVHLAQAFNKVLSKVRRRTRELRQHQRHLDQLVEERTAELHASNQKLRQTQAQMIHSEKMASIGQLAAGVAHEINNPIGFVNSNLYTVKEYCRQIMELLAHYEQLEAGVGDDTAGHSSIPELLEKISQCKKSIDYDFVKEELEEVLDESKEGVERVAGIVKDLKDFSHTDSGKVEYADINHGIDSTLNMVWNQLKYNVTVNKELGELPLVKCDLAKINQVFMNLLVNAGQSIESNGVIDITTRRIDDQVEISIKDNGCGIPSEIMNKIYDPFFTTKDVGSGTGLGLNLVYNIIKSHNGTIEVDSEVGIGTTFTVRLDSEGRDLQASM
jgi:signal transduction histidine kinase